VFTAQALREKYDEAWYRELQHAAEEKKVTGKL